MKRFLSAIIFFLFFNNTSYAQTQKGNFAISGGTNINLLFSNLDPNTNDIVDNKVETQDYSINAGIGYFVIDNLCVNITASYENNYSKKQLYLGAYPGDNNPIYEEDIQKTWAVVPSITYFFPVEGKLKPNISAGVGYMSLKERNNQYSTAENIVYHYAGLSLNGGAGVSYFLNRSVSLDLGFQYSRNKLNDKTNERRSQLQNVYGVIGGLSVYF
ncbi:MAG TPA: outer membrane beta-barrel protein [Hanamia sp.]|nr:outer membrane beta-barrel protein [Hanamia sp.]